MYDSTWPKLKVATVSTDSQAAELLGVGGPWAYMGPIRSQLNTVSLSAVNNY